MPRKPPTPIDGVLISKGMKPTPTRKSGPSSTQGQKAASKSATPKFVSAPGTPKPKPGSLEEKARQRGQANAKNVQQASRTARPR
jgi:hypothetical protein